ncbi:TolC family protein [Synechococcus sp. MU1625]|uniref:TolC family protein n=1 Tax=Synechococcus sp. MU1625 TaxID=2508347 RepID=UPI001CF8E7CE|nr:TolC family protein [Synechococcus sp. MU1625]
MVLTAQYQPLRAEEYRGLTELKTLEVTSEVYDDNQLKAKSPKERISYISLDECIESAISKNPIIRQSVFEINAQKQKFYAAKTLWMPTMEFEGEPFLSQAYEKTSQKLIVTQPNSALSGESGYVSNSSLNEYNLFSLEQDISLELYVNWNIVDATRTPLIKSEWELIKQKENLLKLSTRKLIAEITIAYINAQAEQETIKELKPLIAAVRESEKGVKEQVSIGYSDISKLLQSQTQLLNIVNSKLKAEGELDKYASQIASLIGIGSSKLVYPKEVLKEPKGYSYNLDESIELSKENNELAKAYIDEAESMEWAAVSEQNKYIPKIYLYLNWYYGSSWGINDAPIKNPSISENSYDSYEKGYYAGIGFNWKFDGGASFFNSRSKRMLGESLKESAKSAEISFIGLTKSNYYQYQTGLNTIDIAKKAMTTSSRNLAALKLRSQYGLEDITTLVQAYNLHYESLVQWIGAVRLTNIALANLYRYTSQLPDEAWLDRLLVEN